MAGTRQGGLKAAATNKQRYGADVYVKRGALGGSKPTTELKGFAANRALARRAAADGGRLSKRGFRYIREQGQYRVYQHIKTGEISYHPKEAE